MKPRSTINTAILLCTAGCYHTAAGVESTFPFRLFRQSQAQKEARIRKREEMQQNAAPEGVDVNVDVSWGSSNNNNNNNNNNWSSWSKGAHYHDEDCYTKASKWSKSAKSAKSKSGKSKAGKAKSSKCSGPTPVQPTPAPAPRVPTVEPVPVVTPDPTRRPTPKPSDPFVGPPTYKVSHAIIIFILLNSQTLAFL
jgi:hypothetical protein